MKNIYGNSDKKAKRTFNEDSTVTNGRGRRSKRSSVFENGRDAGPDDKVSYREPRDDTKTDIGEIEEDFESAIENLPPGALVYFGNGKYYKVPYRSNSGSGNKETSADTEEEKLTNSKTKKSTAPTNLKGVQDLVGRNRGTVLLSWGLELYIVKVKCR